MDRKQISPVLLVLGLVIGLLGAGLLVAFWSSVQASPAARFLLARQRWQANAIRHYRLNASYYGNYSQCYYDIEVLQGQTVRTFTSGCLGNGDSKNFTIDGLFESFERYALEQVCSPNGCFCEGYYVVRAEYDEALGYPSRISTRFQRDFLNDVLHAKLGVQQCLRTTPVVDRFERVNLTILP